MNTLFVGRKIIRLNSIDSTNSYANVLLKKDELFEGTIIIAEEQSRGRGQRGADWISEQGRNLTFTVIFYPNFLHPKEQFLLSKAISLGVADFVRTKTDKPVLIKWPNDILIDGKKVAGILIECGIRSNSLSYAVVGIGLNVNQALFSGLSNATSLKKEEQQEYDLGACLEELCSTIESRFLALRADKTSSDQDYLNVLFQFDEWKKYRYNGLPMLGKIIGISNSGKLLVQKEDDETLSCDLKEIVFTY